MAFKSYPFSSSMIKFRQLSLLGQDNIINAASSETPGSAMLALREKGYAKGAPELENPYEFETIVSYELEKSLDFLKSVCPDEKLLELYLLKYDYLNTKTLLKLNLLGKEFSKDDISPYGQISFDILKESIADQSYSRLPVQMSEAMRHLDKSFAINEDATIIGLVMDKAYSKHVGVFLRGVENQKIHKYYQAYFDFTNIMIVLRLKNAGYNSDILDDALLIGGKLFKSDMIKAFEDKSDNAFSYFLKFGSEKHLKEPFEKLSSGGGLFAVEKARDDYLVEVLKEDRYDMFSSSMAIGYLIAKERESAAVRLLMVAKLNAISTEDISKRLKFLYE